MRSDKKHGALCIVSSIIDSTSLFLPPEIRKFLNQGMFLSLPGQLPNQDAFLLQYSVCCNAKPCGRANMPGGEECGMLY